MSCSFWFRFSRRRAKYHFQSGNRSTLQRHYSNSKSAWVSYWNIIIFIIRVNNLFEIYHIYSNAYKVKAEPRDELLRQPWHPKVAPSKRHKHFAKYSLCRLGYNWIKSKYLHSLYKDNDCACTAAWVKRIHWLYYYVVKHWRHEK